MKYLQAADTAYLNPETDLYDKAHFYLVTSLTHYFPVANISPQNPSIQYEPVA